jgi:hypothetical protein
MQDGLAVLPGQPVIDIALTTQLDSDRHAVERHRKLRQRGTNPGPGQEDGLVERHHAIFISQQRSPALQVCGQVLHQRPVFAMRVNMHFTGKITVQIQYQVGIQCQQVQGLAQALQLGFTGSLAMAVRKA